MSEKNVEILIIRPQRQFQELTDSVMTKASWSPSEGYEFFILPSFHFVYLKEKFFSISMAFRTRL